MNDGQSNEQALVELYMGLTGGTEREARDVVMYVCRHKDAEKESAGATSARATLPGPAPYVPSSGEEEEET